MRHTLPLVFLVGLAACGPKPLPLDAAPSASHEAEYLEGYRRTHYICDAEGNATIVLDQDPCGSTSLPLVVAPSASNKVEYLEGNRLGNRETHYTCDAEGKATIVVDHDACKPTSLPLNAAPSASYQASYLEGKWVDNGGTHYTFDAKGNATTVVDHDGEVFPVTSTDPHPNGNVSWVYSVPSTGYVVTHVVDTVGGSTFTATWSNGERRGSRDVPPRVGPARQGGTMTTERARWQRAFDRANTRLSELTVERCKELELLAARSLRFIGPRPPMLKELIRRMKEEPASEDFRDRLHHTLRRLFARMMQAGARYESFETATTGLLDGQQELLEAHLTAELYLRPWGER